MCIISHSLSVCSYQQAQSAAKIGLRKLEDLGIPTTRPDDYYAEMLKTDDHMTKVRSMCDRNMLLYTTVGRVLIARFF